MERGRLYGLDALRFFSAFWVMIAHCLIWGGYKGFIPDAKFAVAIFMILSGYLMALTAGDFTEPREWGRFYLRRFFRIAPLYYFVLLFVAASPWVREGFAAWHRFPPGTFYNPERADFSPGNLALHLSFLFGLSREASTSTLLPDWSLSLEMQFYAVFPAIWLAVRRWGVLRVCPLLAVACLPYWVVARTSWHDPSPLMLQLPYFLAGIVLYEARKAPSLFPFAIAFAVFEAPLSGLWSLAPVAAVLAVFAMDRRPLPASPVFAFGSDVSYAVYLIHGLFIAAGAGMPLWLLIPFVTVGTLASSYALHRLIERPGIALGRRLQQRADRGAVAIAQGRGVDRGVF